MAIALAAGSLVGIEAHNAPVAEAAPLEIQMGDFTAYMSEDTETSAGMADASMTCIRTATTQDQPGQPTRTAGGVYVGNGDVSWLAHGYPTGTTTCNTIADVYHQSALAFAPEAPTSAIAAEPFLLGRVQHQNWVINDTRRDGNRDLGSVLYGNLNIQFGGASGNQGESSPGTSPRLSTTPPRPTPTATRCTGVSSTGSGCGAPRPLRRCGSRGEGDAQRCGRAAVLPLLPGLLRQLVARHHADPHHS